MRRPMTWVYCDPKSRIKIFECAGRAAVFTPLGMTFRNPVFIRAIIWKTIFWPDCPLTSHSAFQLRTYFFRAVSLQRIGATARNRCCEEEQGLHLPRIWTARVIARKWRWRACRPQTEWSNDRVRPSSPWLSARRFPDGNGRRLDRVVLARSSRDYSPRRFSSAACGAPGVGTAQI